MTRFRADDPAPITDEDLSAFGDGLFRISQHGEIRVVEWTAADTRYALVGEARAAELTRLAVQLRSHLSASPSTIAEAPRVEVRSPEAPAIGASGAGTPKAVS